MTEQTEQQIIQFYLDNNLTPIPVYPQTKTPCLDSWKQYENFKPTKEEIAEWFRTYWNPNYWGSNNFAKVRLIQKRREALIREHLTPEEINSKPELLEYDGSISVAILGGKISGNLVLFDDDAGALTKSELEEFKAKTLVIQTASGYHIYIRIPSPPKGTKAGKKGELRGGGAYVIAPPSTHVLGAKYQIISTATGIYQISDGAKATEFLSWASEKLQFQEADSNPITTITNGNLFCYTWHKKFIESFYVDDNLNELALKLFAPSVAKAKADKEAGAKAIYAWAEKCNELKNAALTVDIRKIERMIESASQNDITPMSKDGLKKRHLELYQQLVNAKIIIEGEYKGQQETDGLKESQADRLYKLVLARNIEFFHDQNKTEFARIPIDAIDAIYGISTTNCPLSVEKEGGTQEREKTCDTQNSFRKSENSVIASVVTPQPIAKEIVRLKEEKFKNHMAHLLYESEGKVANNEAIAQVIRLLNYDASHAKRYKLHNRVAYDPSGDGSIWLDTADPLSRAYHITKEGWTLETEVPILFQRYEHQLPLVEAEKDVNPTELLGLLKPFINIGITKETDVTKRQQLLLLVQTASYLVPDIAHPINAMFGCPGSHKSCTQRYLRTIFDNSAAPLLRIPRDEPAAMQLFDHHYIPVIDQIYYMPQWFSDMLCSAVTGAGQETREYYTTDGAFIRAFRRCAMLNGVNKPTTKGDLISRSILHETEPSDERITEKQLDAEYVKVLPKILGGFLNTMVKALSFYGTKEAQPTATFRLMDFYEWGCALSVALGETVESFTQAMKENLERQTEADIENNQVAEAFIKYCSENIQIAGASEESPFKTTPSEVLQIVEEKARALGTNTKNAKRWPSIASAFTRKLNDSKNAVIAYGFNYDIVPAGSKRVMTIWNINAIPAETKHICYQECAYFDKEPCRHNGNLNQMTERPKDCKEFIAKTDTNGRKDLALQRIIDAQRKGEQSTKKSIGDDEAVQILLKDCKIYEVAEGIFRTVGDYA